MPGLSIAPVTPKSPAAASAGPATSGALTENAGDAEGAGGSTFGTILAGQIKGNSQGAKSGTDAKSPEKTEKIDDADKGNVDGLAVDGATTSNAANDFLALVNAGVAAIQITPTPLAPATATQRGGDALALGLGVTAEANDAAATQLTGLLADKTAASADDPIAEGFAGNGKKLPKGGVAGLKGSAAEDDAGRLTMDGLSGNSKILPAAEPLVAKPVLEEFKPGKPMPGVAGVGATDSSVSLFTPQGIAMPGSQAVTTHAPAMEIAVPVGSPGWGNALADKVTWMSSQGSQVAELHLNPQHLGPLDVQLTIVNDQASAVFVSHHPAVREAIEAAMPRLRDMLAESGIMLGNTMVGAESFQQQQQQQQAFAKSSSGRGEMRGEITGMGEVGQAGGRAARVGIGMVDTFV